MTIIDKNYCMSSFLQFRTIADKNYSFCEQYTPKLFEDIAKKHQIHDSIELEAALKHEVKQAISSSNTALALSGGIDSAVLAKFMPKGGKAYTFQCVVPGIQVTNEVPQASLYAHECNLDHEIIEVYWEDFEEYSPLLMKHKGAPIHSIEVQIYKAALQAKKAGYDKIIFGESADLNYGGLSDLMSKDRTVGEFIDRYNYVQPYHVLRNATLITEPYSFYESNGYVDTFEFCRGFFLKEAMGSYTNACECAGIELVVPYYKTTLVSPIDYSRIRSGENKYLIREVFNRLYEDIKAPAKLPMPRPMNEWMANWEGPTRPEFFPNCIVNMNGDQKWMIWALERFLNLIDA